MALRYYLDSVDRLKEKLTDLEICDDDDAIDSFVDDIFYLKNSVHERLAQTTMQQWHSSAIALLIGL